MCIAKIPSHETLTKLRKVCEDKIINSDNVAVFNPIWENYKKYWDKIK